MAAPTGAAFRNSYLSPTLGRYQLDLALLQAAVEAEEASYTSGNFDTIAEAFDSVRSLLDDVQTANADSNNPNP